MAERITVVLADDNLIAREGVRALLALEEDFEVIGVAADYDELVAGAERLAPQAVVTDIRMPPNFEREGIDAAKEIRRRHPGTGIVVLSQYDDPQYAVSLLSDGAAGFAYLLKDRIAEGDQLARAIREVTTGGSLIDPRIVEALVTPVRDDSLTAAEEDLLRQIAAGRHSRRSRFPNGRLPRRFPKRSNASSGGSPTRRAAARSGRCSACGCSTARSSNARSMASG